MSPVNMASTELLAEPETRAQVMGLILSVASCFIISTNLLVAAALLKLLLKKRNQSWCFVLNLALADALVGLAITGLATEDFKTNSENVGENQRSDIYLLTNSSAIPQGKNRCLMRMAFVTSPCTASIMSMFLISLDRFAAIKKPLRYSQLSGRGTAVGFLLALWLSALTLGFLPVMVQQLQTDGYGGFCAFFSVVDPLSIIVLFSVCFFPVVSVFVYIYLDILKIACSHQKQICQVRQVGSRNNEHHRHQDHHHLHQHHHHHLRSYWSHVKALRTVALLVGCFLILWCPFFITCIIHLLCASCQLAQVLENHLWLLGLSNSLINPLVYAFWQREVRLELVSMFPCCRARLRATEPTGVTGRCELQAPATSPAGVSAGETLNPSLLRPIISNDKGQTVSLSTTTSF